MKRLVAYPVAALAFLGFAMLVSGMMLVSWLLKDA